MWNCPVCDRENNTPFCPVCGFDRSADPESHPTLGILSGNGKAASRLRQEREGRLICSGCGSTGFSLDLRSGQLRCRVCGHSHGPVPGKKAVTAIAAGNAHTAVLYDDGTVRAVGNNNWGQCNTGTWRDIVAISAGFENTIGLRRDGTAVAVGNNYENKSMVHPLHNIHSITTGAGGHSLALHSNGTVTAWGCTEHGECHVYHWQDVTAISGGAAHSVGLRRDGRVLTAGDNSFHQCDTGGWSGISAVAAGVWHTLGLKENGTAVARGRNDEHQCDVLSWNNLIQLDGGEYFSAGLRADGTVLIVSNQAAYHVAQSWTSITAIAAGSQHLVGLRADGALLAVGLNDNGQCNVDPLWQ